MTLRISDWSRLDYDKRERVCSTALGRGRRLDEQLHAFVQFTSAMLPAGDGPLALLPYAAKDLFVTPEHAPRAGLASPINGQFAVGAPALDCLDRAGARRIGFTAMTELAYQPSGYSAVSECPRNPWHLDFVPGGSSSGSAVAVASGTVVVALGSDTGGSIRIPAHCCGVTGWKPTWGRVGAAGALPLAPFLDCIGLLARSAADLAPAAEILSSVPGQDRPIEKIAVLTDVMRDTELSVRHACEDGVAALRGIPIAISDANALDAIAKIDEHALRVMQGEAARTHAALLDSPALSPVLRKRLAKGWSIDDTALAESRAMRARLLRDFEAGVLGDADAAVLPVMPIRTPAYAEVDPDSPSFSGRRLYDLSRYCRFVNMLGLPSIAIPVGFDDRGMPVAMQVIGRVGWDRSLIMLAVQMQENTDWHGRAPAAIASSIIDDVELFGVTK